MRAPPRTDRVGRTTVVVVEDHPLHGLLLRRALVRCLPGSDVELFSDGTSALVRLRDPGAPLPDLLVLDLHVPGRSGHELLAECASDARLAAVPAVIVTSSTRVADMQRSLALGARMHLRKPVDADRFAELAEVLAALVRRQPLPAKRTRHPVSPP
jgi:CheY-like chemotaxis protein